MLRRIHWIFESKLFNSEGKWKRRCVKWASERNDNFSNNSLTEQASYISLLQLLIRDVIFRCVKRTITSKSKSSKREILEAFREISNIESSGVFLSAI